MLGEAGPLEQVAMISEGATTYLRRMCSGVAVLAGPTPMSSMETASDATRAADAYVGVGIRKIRLLVDIFSGEWARQPMPYARNVG